MTLGSTQDNKYVSNEEANEVILEPEKEKKNFKHQVPYLKRADSGIGKLYYKGMYGTSFQCKTLHWISKEILPLNCQSSFLKEEIICKKQQQKQVLQFFYFLSPSIVMA